MVGISNFSEIKDVSQNDPKKLGKLLFDNISNMNRDERTKAIKYLCAEGNEEFLSSFMDNIKLKKITPIGAINKLVNMTRDSAVGPEEATILMNALGKSYYEQNFGIDNSGKSKDKKLAYGILFSSVHNYSSFIHNLLQDQIQKFYNKDCFIKDTNDALSSQGVKYSFRKKKLQELYNMIDERDNKLSNLVKSVKKSIAEFTSTLKSKATLRSGTKIRNGKQYQRLD